MPVVPGLHIVPLGIVNVYLLEDGDALTLIDTGAPGHTEKILDAIRALGKQPADVTNILVTHLHSDHTGCLPDLKAATGAPATMHPIDAEAVRQGVCMRPVKPGPSLLSKLVFTLMSRMATPDEIPATEIETTVEDGDVIDIAGGLEVVHLPGHAAGQIGFLWRQHGGVMIVADAAANMLRLSGAPIYEDLAAGMASLQRLGSLDFEVACFGHGKPITEGASARFRRKWGQ